MSQPRTKPARPKSIDAVFEALADPHRRRAIELLGRRPHRAGELADSLGLAAPAMSRHLKMLREAGLVAETHPPDDARVRIYALNASRLGDLRVWLAKAEASWGDQLASFKTHLERG